jgi:hypothetical protein
MNNTAAAFVAPRLDVAKIRDLRASTKLSIEDCIRRSSLGELWREIERGDCKWVSTHLLVRLARPFGCDPAELLSPKCPVSELPECIFVTDSDRRAFLPERMLILPMTVGPVRYEKPHVMSAEYGDVSEEEFEELFSAVT